MLSCACMYVMANEEIKQDDLCPGIKAALDAVPATDTHDHLGPFAEILGWHATSSDTGMSLWCLWATSYFPSLHRLPPGEKT